MDWIEAALAGVGIAFAVAGVILAWLTRNNLRRIEELEHTIADYTRKPLSGIVDILQECYRMLVDATKGGGNIWFVGLTLGFGPAHCIPSVEKIWDTKKKKNSQGLSFAQMASKFNEELGAVLGGAGSGSNVTVVVLKTELLRERFLEPLYETAEYKQHLEQEPDHLDKVEKEILELHEKGVAKAAASSHGVSYLENIPLQVLVTDIKKRDGVKRACVVFHVGTENVGSGAVRGFYSELPFLCEMFSDFAESLCRNR